MWLHHLLMLTLLRLQKISDSNTTIVFSRTCSFGKTSSRTTVVNKLPTGLPPLQQNQSGTTELFELDIQKPVPFVIAVYGAAQLWSIASLPDNAISLLAGLQGLNNADTVPLLALLQSNMSLNSTVWPQQQVLARQSIVQGRPFTPITLSLGGRVDLVKPPAEGTLVLKSVTVTGLAYGQEYNSTTAALGLPLHTFMQSGLWAVISDRCGRPAGWLAWG